jgi:glutamate-ammonia-ligase adenylyltransferase
MDGFLKYLEYHARPWEKQALLKIRSVAGNLTTGQAFIQQARPLLFGLKYEKLRNSVFSMKRHTEDQLRLNGRTWGEVKLGEGSIRDVEFTVQLLQLAYGNKHPEILTGNTLDALSRLASCRLISADEARILTDGYILRTIEHYLQMMDYRQTHGLPKMPAAHLAPAGFTATNRGNSWLAHQHNISIRSNFLRYVRVLRSSTPRSAHPKPRPPPARSTYAHRSHDAIVYRALPPGGNIPSRFHGKTAQQGYPDPN